MDYQKHYTRLVERARGRVLSCYTEKHHVVPRCIGGLDTNDNLVELTPEEHYVAHQLLVKIYPDDERILYAAIMMIPNRPNNKLYGWLRRKLSDAQKKRTGNRNSQYGTMWVTNGTENRKISKSDTIAEGWRIGRSLPQLRKLSNQFSTCGCCGKTFENQSKRKRKYCSHECFWKVNKDNCTSQLKDFRTPKGGRRTDEEKRKISEGMIKYHQKIL